MNTNDNKGFTIIETLVSINLSFIAIAMIFSFFLFAQKFSETLSRNYVDKYVQLNFYYSLEQTLSHCEGFNVLVNSDNIRIITSESDTIYISKDSLSINSTVSFPGILDCQIKIFGTGDQFLQFANNEIINNTFENNTNTPEINSKELTSIIFEQEVNTKRTSYQVFKRVTSITHFKNIKRNSDSDFSPISNSN